MATETITPTPDAATAEARHEAVDHLHNVDCALVTMRDKFEALRAVLRWFEEATEAREREPHRMNALLPYDVGYLRTLLEPFAMDMETYADSVRGELFDALGLLGLKDEMPAPRAAVE